MLTGYLLRTYVTYAVASSELVAVQSDLRSTKYASSNEALDTEPTAICLTHSRCHVVNCLTVRLNTYICTC